MDNPSDVVLHDGHVNAWQDHSMTKAKPNKSELAALARSMGWHGDEARRTHAELTAIVNNRIRWRGQAANPKADEGASADGVKLPGKAAAAESSSASTASATTSTATSPTPTAAAASTFANFREFMVKANLVPPKNLRANGKIQTCGTTHKPRGTDGRYWLTADPAPHGWVFNWHEEEEGGRCWFDDTLPPEVLEAFKATAAEHIKAEAAERAAAQQSAAVTAKGLWEAAVPIGEDGHPYLARKCIKALGARQDEQGRLVIPVQDEHGAIHSVQTIGADGFKSFMAGGAMAGHFRIIGAESLAEAGQSPTVLIAEGYATAATIHEATTRPVVVAFNAGNLMAVASTVRKALPAKPDFKIVVCADDDHETAGNPGMSKAKDAAVAIGAMLAVPWPLGNPPAGQTDFNDLHVCRGLAAVQEAFGHAVYPQGDDLIDAHLAAQKNDPSAMVHPKVLAMLRVVRATNPQRWTVIYQSVKQCRNIKMDYFDKLTTPDKAEEKASMFPNDEPWEDEVDGAELLDELVAMIRRFIICDDESLNAIALWTLASYFVPVAKYAPILNVTAAAKRCGKSTVLEVLLRLALKAFMTSNISSAAIYRFIEKYQPTLLIDEVDAFLAEIPDARSILDSGVQPNGRAVRCQGDENEPVHFNTFGFKALAGIGDLANTLNDRSIKVRMRRKFTHETTHNIRHAKDDDFSDMRRKMLRFAEDRSADFAAIRPAQIKEIHDRANDCWEPLLQVAELAGSAWLAQAVTTAVSLMTTSDDGPEDTDAEILASVRRAFAVNEVDKISLVALTETLNHEDDGRWSGYNGGKPIDKGQISKRMKHFLGIPVPIRQPASTVYKAIGNPALLVAKGYSLTKCEDAFRRYLSPVTEEEAAHWKEVAEGFVPGAYLKPSI